MAFIGTILQESIRLRQNIAAGRIRATPFLQQHKILEKILGNAEETLFGTDHDFVSIQNAKDMPQAFRQAVPLTNYETMLKGYWHRTLNDEEDICHPGRTKFFALTSGTSEAASKKIPVTANMIRAVRRTSIRQMLTLSNFDLPGNFYEKGVLMLGGSTQLQKMGQHFEGDLSGILASNLPFWFYRFYKPGRKLAMERDWTTKLELITQEAARWDIGIIAGVPAWVQILIEKIIEHHKVKHIHDIWPNLKFFVHGGVAFEPYKKGFRNLLGQDINYMETYLASEGFMAFQSGGEEHMHLVLDNGIFFEFIPYNEDNFDDAGNLLPHAKTLLIHEVREDVDYAVVITTNAGTFRYLIGDTIRFVDCSRNQIIITGRTKHFISLCGEHLSVDNMNRGIEKVGEQFNCEIREFSVAGIPHDGLFAHQWYIAMDKEADPDQVRNILDKTLAEVNDDYGVERKAALKDVWIKLLPTEAFYGFMRHLGKEGGQHKFPRVLKGDILNKWTQYLKTNRYD
ncbi:MAG: GH3 auxin-responsive promoter family protein [Flavobacteriales bacterium]|nr:GH3 auxin-responsive promoter family protein [Flavobacteriales bacterium]MCB9447584.1 GH3 auxin-responsive promoter family protein [Flavobacteriales bacterium]